MNHQALISSMTGFARHEGSFGDIDWVLEARSVNGRTLEVKLRYPTGFDSVERAAKEIAKSLFQRGQIGVTLTLKRPEVKADFSINQPVLDHYLELGRELMQQGQVSMPSLDGLLGLKGVIETLSPETLSDADTLGEPLAEAMRSVLLTLKAARQDEGQALLTIVLGQLSQMSACLSEAEALAITQIEVIRDRFSRRLSELLPEADMVERILQEASVLAVKADIREELDRLRAHIASAHNLLKAESSQGRKLDFLCQEFMREANTLCAKAATSELTAIGLELKSVIDQFREQIQNLE
jgi:uncharacterized protein (TIGR00255 family)